MKVLWKSTKSSNGAVLMMTYNFQKDCSPSSSAKCKRNIKRFHAQLIRSLYCVYICILVQISFLQTLSIKVQLTLDHVLFPVHSIVTDWSVFFIVFSQTEPNKSRNKVLFSNHTVLVILEGKIREAPFFKVQSCKVTVCLVWNYRLLGKLE